MQEDALHPVPAVGGRVGWLQADDLNSRRVTALSSAELETPGTSTSPESVLPAPAPAVAQRECGYEREQEGEVGPSGAMHGAGGQRKQSVGGYIDNLLAESMRSFHSDGVLVPPLHTALSGAALPPALDLRSCLALVCDVKGFEYGIYWERRLAADGSQVLEYDTGYTVAGISSGANLFFEHSKTFFSFRVGFGVIGLAAYNASHVWVHDPTPWGTTMTRRDAYADAGMRTFCAVPLAGGVVELGSSSFVPESHATLQYVQQICGPASESRLYTQGARAAGAI